MILKNILFLLPVLILGILMVFLFLPHTTSKRYLLTLILGGLVGLGFHSLLSFWGLFISTTVRMAVVWVEWTLLLVLLYLCLRKIRLTSWRAFFIHLRQAIFSPNRFQIIFFLLLIGFIVTFVSSTLMKPMGQFDAHSMWNYKAKAMFITPGDLVQALRHPTDVTFHPDYPLLIPMLVNDLWVKLGEITSRSPIILAVFFTTALVVLMYAGVAALRDDSQALMAAVLLIGAPYLSLIGSGQTADIPLSVYLLAAITLMILAYRENHWRYAALSGFMAGLAAWTKNEGLLFVVALFLANGWILRNQLTKTRMGQLAAWWLGAFLPLLTVFIFKANMSVQNDLFVGFDWGRLLQLDRVFVILTALGKEVLFWGGWEIPILAVFIASMVLLRRQMSAEEKKETGLMGAFTLIAWMGFFTIYLITPRDLEWHLRYSADRLMFQLYPPVVMGVMLFTLSIKEVVAKLPIGNRLRRLFLPDQMEPSLQNKS
jgi:hypothetical protein